MRIEKNEKELKIFLTGRIDASSAPDVEKELSENTGDLNGRDLIMDAVKKQGIAFFPIWIKS